MSVLKSLPFLSGRKSDPPTTPRSSSINLTTATTSSRQDFEPRIREEMSSPQTSEASEAAYGTPADQRGLHNQRLRDHLSTNGRS